MKKLLIISLLVLQTSASFFDVFAPVENSFGKLITDVVSDLKETIDCTIYAVERVLSLDGIFGHRPSNYDERCGGHKEEQSVGSGQPPSDSEETSTEKPQARATKEMLSQEINNSVSKTTQHIKTILEQGQAQGKIENVKDSLKNETERLTQISLILSQQLSKIPEDVRKKFDFNQDRPSLENVLDEVKFLYKVEQKHKGSAEANEVRQVFYQVLKVLHANITNNQLSDEDEVKNIIENLSKISNASLVDAGNQVSQWTEEQRQLVIMTKNDTPTSLSEIVDNDGKNNHDTKRLNNIIHKKNNDMGKGQIKMVGFSRSLKNFAKSEPYKVNNTGTSHNDTIKPSTEHTVDSTDQFLSHKTTEVSVSTTDTPETIEQITTVSQQPNIPRMSEQTTVPGEGSPSINQSSENIENATYSFVDSSTESKIRSHGSSILDQIHVFDESISQLQNETYAASSRSVNDTFPMTQTNEQTTFSKDSHSENSSTNIIPILSSLVLEKSNISVSLSQAEITPSTKQSGQATEHVTATYHSKHKVDNNSSIPLTNAPSSLVLSSSETVNNVTSNGTIEQITISKTATSSQPHNEVNMSTSPLLSLTKQKFASSIKFMSEPVNDDSRVSPSPQTLEPTTKVAVSSQPNNNVDISTTSMPTLLKQPSVSVQFSSQTVNVASISMIQNIQINETSAVPIYPTGVNISSASVPLSKTQKTVPSVKSSSQSATDTNTSATQLQQANDRTSIASVSSNQKNKVSTSTTQSPHSEEQVRVPNEHDIPTKQLPPQRQNRLTVPSAVLESQLDGVSSSEQPPQSTVQTNNSTEPWSPLLTKLKSSFTKVTPLKLQQLTPQQVNLATVQEQSNIASRVIEQDRSNIVNQVIEQEKSNIENRVSEQDRSNIVNRVIEQEKSNIENRVREQYRSNIVNPVIEQEKSNIANRVMTQASVPSVKTNASLIPASQSTQTNRTELRTTTQPKPSGAQNVARPSTAPPVLKTFQDVAKSIFAESSASAKHREEELTQSVFDQFENEDDPFAVDPSAEEEQSSIFHELFEPQDHASQKAAVENAKSIIAQSKQSNALMNNILKNADRAAALSPFENSDEFFDFGTK